MSMMLQLFFSTAASWSTNWSYHTTLKWLMVKCCKAEQAISRGGYKQQMGIIIDSVTQAFYMHEEQRLKDFLVHLKILESQLTSCSVMHTIHCTLLLLQLFISDPVCLSEWVSEAWEVWSDHNTPPRTVNGHSFMLDRQKMPLISLFMVSKEPGCSGRTIWLCRHSQHCCRSYTATHTHTSLNDTYKHIQEEILWFSSTDLAALICMHSCTSYAVIYTCKHRDPLACLRVKFRVKFIT